MSEGKTVTHNGGIGFGAALFIVFLVLKLVGTIDWSWWWVAAPLWIPLAVTLAVLTVAAVVIGVGRALKDRNRWKAQCR